MSTETPAAQSTDYSQTREAWLRRAADLMRPRLVEVFGEEIPSYRVSVGFAYGARAESGKILGVTYSGKVVSDGQFEVFISPEDADTASMLTTLLHELIHVCVGTEEGHKGRFAELATRLGFEGPMTATPPSIELAAEMMVMAAELGPYPGSQINIPTRVRTDVKLPVGPNGKPIKVTSGPATQTNRNIAIHCPKCGWSGRSYRKQIERGLPYCGTEDAEGTPCLTRLEEK